jgi:hypothetical protein
MKQVIYKLENGEIKTEVTNASYSEIVKRNEALGYKLLHWYIIE